jgi:hypothetical protein
MKKIFTISSFLILSVVLLAGCTRRGYSNDEDYWLSKERGVVVYSDNYCPYYVVETGNGYTIIESGGGSKPYENDVIYGDLSRPGYINIYNRSTGIVISGSVVNYWLTYSDAQYAIDNLCY